MSLVWLNRFQKKAKRHGYRPHTARVTVAVLESISVDFVAILRPQNRSVFPDPSRSFVMEFDQCIGTNPSNSPPKVLYVAIARTRSQASQGTCRTRTSSFTYAPTVTNPRFSKEARSIPGRYLEGRLDTFLSTSVACIKKPERVLVRVHIRPVYCCVGNSS